MWTSRGPLPRPAPLSRQIVVIGRGAGLGAVLSALRGLDVALTAIVTTARRVGPGGDHASAVPGAEEELSRGLRALADEREALARVLARPLAIDRLGRRPLGDYVLRSLTSGFGDLATASLWLGEQLGLPGAVLPAALTPLRYRVAEGDSSRSLAHSRLELLPADPAVPDTLPAAIAAADGILLAPGDVYAGPLLAASIPALGQAMAAAHGQIVLVANLTPQTDEPLDAHLALLGDHGLRVDAVLHDPAARLSWGAGSIFDSQVAAMAAPLAGARPDRHDPGLLRDALAGVLGLTAREPAGERVR